MSDATKLTVNLEPTDLDRAQAEARKLLTDNLAFPEQVPHTFRAIVDLILKQRAEAAAEEREACITIALELTRSGMSIRTNIAAAIRARGAK